MSISTLDLMLGNYVQLPTGEYGIVEEIHPLSVRVSVCQDASKFYKAKDVSPIPIDSFVLQRAGFMFLKTDDNDWWELRIGELLLNADESTLFQTVFVNCGKWELNKIKYVHELQQLVKYFKKEELYLEL